MYVFVCMYVCVYACMYVCVRVCIRRSTYIKYNVYSVPYIYRLCLLACMRTCMCQNARVHLQKAMSELSRERDKLKADSIIYN